MNKSGKSLYLYADKLKFEPVDMQIQINEIVDTATLFWAKYKYTSVLIVIILFKAFICWPKVIQTITRKAHCWFYLTTTEQYLPTYKEHMEAYAMYVKELNGLIGSHYKEYSLFGQDAPKICWNEAR